MCPLFELSAASNVKPTEGRKECVVLPRPGPARAPRRRRIWWFILAYLGLQLLLPLRLFVHDDPFDSSGNFTWNMFSVYWSCRGGYELTTPDGQTRELEYLRAFQQPRGAGQVTYRDRLPEFHRWLCERIESAGELGQLQGRIACSVNGGPPEELVARQVDLCSAPNYGVLLR
jgi:hypothetical protein